jgi:cyclase
LKGRGLYKTKKFKDPIYIGDPINAVKIFNEKEVDELIFLDIGATSSKLGPNFEILTDIASEAFMPLAYGGGVSNLNQMEKIFRIGFEKIVINTSLFINPSLIKEAVQVFGSQSIVASLDIKKSFWGNYDVFYSSGKHSAKLDVSKACSYVEDLGIGEIFLNSIDKDGMMEGMDVDVIKLVSSVVSVPLVACGGAGKFSDLVIAVKEGGASAVSAGSFFVFHGKHKAVLITYPSGEEIDKGFHNG